MDAPDEVRERILTAVPEAQIEIPEKGEPSIRVDVAHLKDVAHFLKENEALRMDMCTCVTGVDWPEAGEIEVVYHLFSIEKKIGPVVLKVRVPREEAACECPSLVPLWRGAEYQEREVFDLFGVRFAGHPDLRRILMWDGFVGYPMRKDYEYPDEYHGISCK